MGPIKNVREISRIAYGFMASKALFAALNLDLFTRLSGQPKTLGELSQETGIASNRLLTLLTACISVGLLAKDGDRYANAPASETYLVRSATAYFGDYFRFQVDRQIYPMFEHLDTALRGDRRDFWQLWEDQEEADNFSRAQHSGSLGPAHVMAKLVDFRGCRKLLDVGGGSGAFSITLCRRYPEMTATILDLPKMRPVAERFVREAGLETHIGYVSGSALETEWPAPQDAVLMSYLLSTVAEKSVVDLIDHAFRVLKPGGHLMLHDFMVRDDRTGPDYAALWLVSGVFADSEAVSLTAGWLSNLVSEKGLIDISVRDLIPGITKLMMATKPVGKTR